ncbi:AMMECR1 domain-containing protein [Dendryphion nanum]|uniref:AMMECR1 domain-containing protein n=1 Tax=Dendryphion nanum TaxID=256645 RepID=A0A9P9EEV0_9PLEO|nr:AMMECR1 domain-containing protein [Dendryphion nanum]
MATQAHCAYCFETLSASLEKRASLSLHDVLAFWKKYNDDPSDEVDLEVEPSDSDMDEVASPNSASINENLRPAAISRLLAPSPSSTSSSSIQSTGSTPSNGLSEASSATSKSSSRSSFFSLGKRSQKEKGTADLEDHPLFVTWNTLYKSDKRLRGCIGTFEPQPLDDGLRSYALTSAFDDTRFNPISIRELPTLECGVTLLTNFEPVASAMDWELGKHGLRISFVYHGRRYGSTYLPDVAKEQGWTKEETIVSLMRKAGWNGKKEDWKKVDLNVIRYQGKQVRLDYSEYKEWRDWVKEAGEGA